MQANGHPSCYGGTAHVVQLARGRETVFGGRDAPGQHGAVRLVCELRPVCPSVEIIVPPLGIKDARGWLQAGATRHDIEITLRNGSIVRFAEHTDRADGLSYRETG